ncbi:MAG: hypothetical protein HZB55_09080 [Deltaproteobacteria bacterium]|nr:hypothetical protein [Deltaproteobacteria bacterium]
MRRARAVRRPPKRALSRVPAPISPSPSSGLIDRMMRFEDDLGDREVAGFRTDFLQDKGS